MHKDNYKMRQETNIKILGFGAIYIWDLTVHLQDLGYELMYHLWNGFQFSYIVSIYSRIPS